MMLAMADPTCKSAFERSQARAGKSKVRPESKGMPDAVPILKFFARTRIRARFKLNGQARDPYQVVDEPVWRFDGTFGYSPNDGGFVPFGTHEKLTPLLANYVAARNVDRIERAWERIRSSLCSPTGGVPVLIHKFEQQHVYFMRRCDTGQIKIGVSIRPGVRLMQLMAQLRVRLEILHILPAAGREMEKTLHSRFASLCSGGEWFRPDRELMDFIREQQQARAVA
jgi:hypothetical protein